MQNTLKFLAGLKKNNSKEWFDKNKSTYQACKKEFEELVAKIIKASLSFDPELSGIEASKCLFRINRDIRFSKDKSPYKTNFGASINPGGKKSMKAGYYIHIEPGKCFLAAGTYMPEPPILNAIRQEIDYNSKEFNKIISAKDFKTNFKELDKDDSLKNVPKGYEKDNPNAELLKLKHFIVVYNFKDKDLDEKNFDKTAAKIYKSALPLNKFLRRVQE